MLAWKKSIAGAVTAVALLLVNDLFFFESIHVPSSSMRPTILPNERIFVQRHLNRDYKRWDVVVIKSEAFHHRIIKRIAALPGECVTLLDSWRVAIKGATISYETDAQDPTLVSEDGHSIQLRANPKFSFPTKFGKTELCLGADEYYVLGDNRLASDDSRTVGPVHLREIQGRARAIWYSFDKTTSHLRKARILTPVE